MAQPAYRLPSTTGIGGIFNSAEFILPLGDLGAGAVDTSLARGVGPATFTRATTAWTKLASGLWASVASGVPRSSYIGLTTAVGAYGGYFAEGAGTQLVTPTASIRDMTNAAWVKVTMTTAKTSTGIDGVGSSCTRLTATAGNGTILQTLVAAASSRTYSAWVKRVTGTGPIVLTDDGGVSGLQIASLINSATFTLVQINESVLNSAFGFVIGDSGDAIDVDFNQFEAGSFATSPMDAAGAVRNADVLTYATAGNFSDTAGAAYAEYRTYKTGGYLAVVGSTGTNRGPLAEGVGANGAATMADGTTAVETVATGVVNTSYKGASSWSGSTMQVTAGGVAVVSGAYDGSFTLTNVNIGGDGGSAQSLGGYVKDIRIWSRQLPNAVLQALTA